MITTFRIFPGALLAQAERRNHLCKRYLARSLLVVLTLLTCGPAFPATFEVRYDEVRIQGDAPGVEITILDDSGKVVETATARLEGGRFTYRVQYRSPFTVKVRDLTERELQEAEPKDLKRRVTFNVWKDEVRIQGDAPGVEITILDYFGKSVETATVRLEGVRYTYRVKYTSPFTVQVRDVTETEIRDKEFEDMKRRVEELEKSRLAPDPSVTFPGIFPPPRR